MSAAWMVARLEVRRRWRGLVVVVIVAGLGAGFALTAGVGARRTWTAWSRLQRATLAPNAVFSVPPDADPAKVARLRRLPEVEAIGNFSYVPVAPEPLVPGQDAGGFVAVDQSFGQTIYRPLIVAGRRANPHKPGEVTVNEALAAKGVRVGRRVRLRYGFGSDARYIATALVVGVERGEFDLGINSGNAAVMLSNSFLAAHRDQLEVGPSSGGLVRLRGGAAGRARFEQSLHRLFGPQSFVAAGDPLGDPVHQVLTVQRTAWGLLALFAALALLVAAAQAVVRLVAASAVGTPALRALGMRRRQLAAVGALEGAVAGAAVGFIGVVVAVLASSEVPSGLARRADPDHGIRVEPVVLVAGFVLLVVVLVAAGALGLWRASGGERLGRPRRGQARLRRSVPWSLGTQWALGRSSQAAAPSARSAIVATAVGLAGVTAVLTFATSSARLHKSARLYGWTFDAAYVASETDPTELPATFPRLAGDPDVKALAWGGIVDIVVEGTPVETYALEQAKGSVVHPTLLEGRPPGGPGEIALGSGTLRELHRHVGDTVAVAGQSGPVTMRIVGRAAYPELGNNGDVRHMASISARALSQLQSQPVSAIALIDVRDGASRRRVIQRHAVPDAAETTFPFESKSVRNLRAAGSIPWSLAAFLGLLGLAAVGHALVTSVRARRAEIAVLRSIGAVRRQVRLSVAAQAVLTVVIGAVIGLPVGVAAGRWGWALVAHGLGVLERSIVPLAAVAGSMAAAAVVALGLSAVPAALAARVRPAAILRAE